MENTEIQAGFAQNTADQVINNTPAPEVKQAGFNVNVENEVTGLPSIKPIPALDNFTPLNLIGVRVDMTTSEKSKDVYEYHNKTVPVLTFEFRQALVPAGEPERGMTITYKPIVHKKNDGSIIEDAKLQEFYLDQYNCIKHILDAYKFAPNWKNIPQIPNFIFSDPIETRIAKFTAMYNSVVEAMTLGNNNAPSYKTVEGKPYLMIGKCIINAGEFWFSFPRKIGKTGFLEGLKLNAEKKLITVLVFNPSDSIIAKKVEPKAAGANQMPGAPAMPVSAEDIDVSKL